MSYVRLHSEVGNETTTMWLHMKIYNSTSTTLIFVSVLSKDVKQHVKVEEFKLEKQEARKEGEEVKCVTEGGVNQ